MQPSSPNHHLQSMASDGSAKKVRKPYTITKSRESWTEEEHDKFLEALRLFDRDWKKIEDFIGSKTVIQIRSHAQKYFLKVQKNGIIAHVPPPRPKRKATLPYPQKDSKNALVPLQVSTAYPSALSCLSPRHPPWDDTTTLLNTASSVHVPSQENYTALEGVEEDGIMGIARRDNRNFCIGSSTQILGNCETPEQGSQSSLCHGIPDFAEVYNFIGSIFDPSTKGHMQKLKEMTPINVETVLLLMRNLTLNLSSSDFKQFRKLVSSNDIDSKWVGGVKGVVAANPISDHLPFQTPATG